LAERPVGGVRFDQGQQWCAPQISATRGTSGLVVDADGKTSRADQNVFPASPWNPKLYATQDGAGHPRRAGRSHSVIDDGTEDLSLGASAMKAHYYEIKGRYSQDIWSDERGRLVQVKLIGSDGSVILYKPI
jgi:hypothetical protein